MPSFCTNRVRTSPGWAWTPRSTRAIFPDGSSGWFVTSYAEARALLADPRLRNSHPAAEQDKRVRVFKEPAGETPHRFLTRLRVEEAQRRLRSADLPIAEIAPSCGFASPGALVDDVPAAYRGAAVGVSQLLIAVSATSGIDSVSTPPLGSGSCQIRTRWPCGGVRGTCCCWFRYSCW
jgi:hypothetical protein